jgi:transcriptional regulator with XRE-family HTH domain
MRFGEMIRELRTAKGLTLRALGEQVGVSHAYISKVENGKLDFGDFPGEALICRLAAALDADEEELLLLAEKIPEAIRRRFFERPDAFRQIARLDDRRLDRVLALITGGRRASAASPHTGFRRGESC